MNRGMLQVWRADKCQLLMQIHDAILVQYPAEKEDEVLPEISKLVLTPIELNHGRELVIPYEIKVGWNWSDWSEKNPDGLKKYTGRDARSRTKEVTGLDRSLC
jgi:hypothetical protein